jgi:hypothetical protein
LPLDTRKSGYSIYVLTTSSGGGEDIDITAAEAAKRIGVTRQAATIWAQEGKFSGARKDEYSGMWRIPETSVDQMKRERETAKS